MKKLLLTFLLLSASAFASLSNVYVAQASAGSNNGTSCANAFAATFFNSGANWGAGGAQIGAGTTVHLCGTITSSLAAQGSGSMGSPVTILFETAAIIQQPVCDASLGCLSISGQSYIVVDGGSTCGWINGGSLVACNGIIQSTLNGTPGAACPGGACSHQADSIGLVASNCSNCEVRNLNIINIYVHTLTTDTHSFGTFPSAIYWNNESNSIPNVLVHNNVIHDCAWCLLDNYGSDSNFKFYNNDISHAAHGIAVAGFGANAATGIHIYSNHFHDFDNWDTGAADTYHIAGIHAYGTTVSNTTDTEVYNNLFSGSITTMDFTAWIYLENFQYSSLVFNNVILAPPSGTASFGMIAVGGGSSSAPTAAVLNNTILDDGNGICILVNNVAGTAMITVANNLCSGAATGIYYYTTGTYLIDYNTYAAMAGSNTFYDGTSYYSTIAAWRTAVSQDAHSQLIATAHVNSNGTLQATSAAIKWADNFTSLSVAPLDSDFSGIARPAGTCVTQGTSTCWDDGAFQFVPGASCGSGSSTITGALVQGQTHRQAVLAFSVPHANAATVQLFTDSSCTQVIDDTNTSLFSGSSNANRSGSVVNGSVSGGSTDGAFVQFVAGTLTGNRALTQATSYWAQITNTADSSQVTVPFKTAAMPLGNTFPEQPIASTSRWDNRGYPVFALGPSGRNTLLTDPTTGLLVKRGTFAGDTYSQKYVVGDGSGQAPPFDTPIDNTGGCTSTANLASSNVNGYPSVPGSGYATCPNNLSVWLPLPTFTPPGGGTWGNNEGAYAATNGLDYVNLYVFGSTSSGTTVLTITPTLTATGAAYHGSPGITVTLNSATNAGFIVPCVSSCASGSVPDPGFASWGFAQAPIRGDMLPSQTTVGVSGHIVTATAGDPFQSTWPSGSLILIPGSSSWTGTPCTNSRCHVSAVTSSTTLTIAENCTGGCPTSASAISRIFGFKITGNGAGGTVSLQAGYEFGTSPPWQVGEDAGQQHCNSNSVTVTTTATGTPYSGFTLNGNICWIQYDAFQRGAFYLFIPTDQNGAPLGEMRPLGWTTNAINWSSNGASMATPSFSFAGWDPTQGNKGYATLSYNSGATVLLVSFIYDTTKSGCNPAYTNWAGMALYQGWIAFANSPTDPCFTYTNLTNPTNSTDVVTQIKSNYSAISTAALGLGTGTVYLDGYFLVTLGGGGNPELSVGATFDTTGTLTQTFDSFSQYPARWGAVHGPLHQIGTFHSWTMDPTFSGSSGNALQGPWQTVTDNINTAGFGSTPTWAGNSTLDNGTVNQYLCPTSAQMQALGVSPTLANAMVALGSAGNHCVEIEVTTPPYSATPQSGTPYPGGMTEQQQFPCGFSSMFSCLQPLAVGDHFMDPSLGSFGEGFIIVTPPVSGGGSKLQMWVIRGSGLWPNNLRNPYATLQPHLNGWTGYMQALQIVGCTPMYGDSSTMTHTWTEGFFGFCLSHGADTRGTLSSNENVMSQNLVNPTFDTLFNASIATNAMPTWYATSSLGNTLTYPTFNGSTSALNNGNLIQLYADAGNLSGTAFQRQWALGERHLNPSNITGQENPVGMGTSGYTLSLVGGKNQTYTITDPYSNGAADPKNLPFMAWAGRYLLTDYSGLSSAIPDTGQGFCLALVASECVAGSSPGTRYVSIPAATGCTQGLMNQHSTLCPAVVNAGIAAQMQQVFMNGLDLGALKQRILGQALTGAGRQWQFNGPKLTPDGNWYFMTCVYPDGLRTDVCVGQIPTSPSDSLNRSTFIQVPIQSGGTSGDTVRIEFWYNEFGGCTQRADHCFTTSGPTGSSPYLFSYETQAYTTCSSGCAVPVPALPGRILYYALHRKNGSETTGQVNVVAVK